MVVSDWIFDKLSFTIIGVFLAVTRHFAAEFYTNISFMENRSCEDSNSVPQFTDA